MNAKKKQEESHDEYVDDLEYEEDQGAALVKKLRTKLKKCEEEKKTNLDGWQRAQADALNARRKHTEEIARVKERTVADFVENLLPALDSFDMAFQGKAWESVDETWRKGIEHVHTQLLKSLESKGVTRFGTVGEAFDPKLHEAIAHQEGGESDTIARIARYGYKIGDTLIRPAQVAVYQ